MRGGVHDDLLAGVCRQIEAHGLKLKEAEAAILDATLVESAARPRTHIAVPEDRAEGDTPDDPEVHFSTDPDARWVEKGAKSTLGHKAFARTDEEGLVDKVHATPANRADSPEFETMIEGTKARRVIADKAHASKANRDRLRGKHRDGVMRKAARNRPLRASEKRFNKLISERRFRVEQCFDTMKRLFGLHRARYFRVARAHAQLAPLGIFSPGKEPAGQWMPAIGQNLLEAANKTTLKPQTPAIAQTETTKPIYPLNWQPADRDAQIKPATENNGTAQRSFEAHHCRQASGPRALQPRADVSCTGRVWVSRSKHSAVNHPRAATKNGKVPNGLLSSR